MRKGEKPPSLNYRKKNRKKVIRTIFQGIILVYLAVVILRTLVDFNTYQEPDQGQWSNQEGFIALSYFGVARSGTNTLIGKDRLAAHLQALHQNGYQTISQQNVLDYYKQNKPLPEKALFLSFEDGRNDSGLFTQPLLEKYGYKATMLSYANKVNNREAKFLQAKDLIKMTQNGFWELGSNGYRLSYINIFDRAGNYVGEREEAAFLNQGLAQSYNHYLMDFIRDRNRIPLENREEMEARISSDYEAMEEIYQQQLGYIPQVYMIMHANYLNNGMNRLVEDINNQHIQRIFKIHFNREGESFNDLDQNLYDLTRVQPASYWYTNHLLMKIQEDTNQPMIFSEGDQNRKEEWQLQEGAAEFAHNSIILTSPPAQEGLLLLKNSEGLQNFKVTVKLSGNVIGCQTLYLGYDQQGKKQVTISIQDHQLIVKETVGAYQVKTLLIKELEPLPWEYDPVPPKENPVNVVDQAHPDLQAEERQYPINRAHPYELAVQIKENQIVVWVDGIQHLETALEPKNWAGGVALGAQASSQNRKENIYDGVFDDLKIVLLEAEDGEKTVFFENGYRGLEKVFIPVQNLIYRVIDWAVDTF